MPNFFINVKEKGAKKASKNIGTLTGSMKRMALQAVTVAAVMQGVRKSIQMSAEMEGVKRGFDNLAKSSGFSTAAFNKFRKATDGTIDSLTLMKQANNAMLLGISDSEEQMAQMFDVAQRLGQSLGIETTQAVESLVTGLGRQSKLMLDNLGIMVDTNKSYEDYAESIGKSTSELTDQERKQAFVNAAMEEANTLVSQLGVEQLTAKDKIAQMNTSLGDLAITLGDALAPIVTKTVQCITKLVHEISKLGLAPLERLVDSLEEIGGNEDLVTSLKIDVAKQKIKELNEELMLENDGTLVTKENLEDMEKAASALTLKTHALAGELQETGDLTGQALLNQVRWAEEDKKKAESREKSHLILIEIAALEAQIKASREEDVDLSKQVESVGKIKQAWKDFYKSKISMTDKEILADTKAAAMQSTNAQQAMSNVVKAETMEAMSGIIASIFKSMPYPLNLILAAGAGGMVSGIMDRTLGSVKAFATGGDFVTSGPQMVMVGDNPGGRERVQVTPLSSPNIEGPQGSTINVSVSGNVLSQDFVEGELAENIKEAVRRGTDFGIS